MGDQPMPASLYGRPDSIVIFVASLTNGEHLCQILLRILADLATQALRAKDIRHVCIVHAFGEAAKLAVQETKTRLPLLQRPEVQQDYVFEVDESSIDGENPPRFFFLVGCENCPKRRTARQIVRAVLERANIASTDAKHVPMLIVEAQPEKHDAEKDRSPSAQCQVVPEGGAADALEHLLQPEGEEPTSAILKRAPRPPRRRMA